MLQVHNSGQLVTLEDYQYFSVTLNRVRYVARRGTAFGPPTVV
jgi:hypothetical protein